MELIKEVDNSINLFEGLLDWNIKELNNFMESNSFVLINTPLQRKYALKLQEIIDIRKSIDYLTSHRQEIILNFY